MSKVQKLISKYKCREEEAIHEARKYQYKIDDYSIPTHRHRNDASAPTTSLDRLIYHRDMWQARAAIYKNMIEDLNNLEC